MTTNKKTAQEDQVFRLACKLARVAPTQRQAAKFKRKEGRAWPYEKSAAILWRQGHRA